MNALDLDPNVAVLDLHLVPLQLDGREVLALPRRDVELPLMERARDHGAVELALAERAARMGAAVLRRVDRPADVVDRAGEAVEIDLAPAPFRQIVEPADLPELRGRGLGRARV